jgi:gluconokinase
VANKSVDLPIVVMGVSGSGKSTIAKILADRTGSVFLDADDLHTPDNISRMTAGTALGDELRLPWLHSVGKVIREQIDEGNQVVVACSALKQSYRDLLRSYSPDLYFIFLDGSREVIQSRVEARNHRFMPMSLLDSQFESLEPLTSEESGISVDIVETPKAIVEEIVNVLDASSQLSKTRK